MAEQPVDRVTPAELAAEGVTALPEKEVLSLLDLNANLDLALDAAAPIDLAVGANANIAAPIDAAVGANVLSPGAAAIADAPQTAEIHQGITGDASATAAQDSTIDQGATTDGASTAGATDATGGTIGSDGNLLNVNVDLNGDLNLAAPIDGAVAANANAAAPIDAAVSANIGSPLSESVAAAHQDVVIDQNITGDATATGDQTSGISQP